MFIFCVCRSGDQIRGIANAAISEEEDDNNTAFDEKPEKIIEMDMDLRDPITGSIRTEEKLKLMQLLGQWEDPDSNYTRHQVS